MSDPIARLPDPALVEPKIPDQNQRILVIFDSHYKHQQLLFASPSTIVDFETSDEPLDFVDLWTKLLLPIRNHFILP
jgi:hypothetical protein